MDLVEEVLAAALAAADLAEAPAAALAVDPAEADLEVPADSEAALIIADRISVITVRAITTDRAFLALARVITDTAAEDALAASLAP